MRKSTTAENQRMRRRLFWIAIATILILPAFCGDDGEDGSGYGGGSGRDERKFFYVEAEVLNVRTCADLTCDVVSKLKKGDRVEIRREQDGWFELEDSNWASAKYFSSKAIVVKKPAVEELRSPEIQPPFCEQDTPHFNAWAICEEQVQRLANYDFEWTDGFFESKWNTGERCVESSQIWILQGDKIKFQNGFGAWKHVAYRCVYFDLLKMAGVDIIE